MIIQSNSLSIPLQDKSVQCVITSPPYYGLRDYGVSGQIGAEESMQEYISTICSVFDELWRVLKDDGVAWLNLGDSYAGTNSQASFGGRAGFVTKREVLVERLDLKPKNLMLIPHRVAIALQNIGWYLRQDIVWAKPNPMPESVKDRCTKAHEYMFMLTKREKYYCDMEVIREEAKGGNKRSVWHIPTQSYSEAHFATFPEALVEPPILSTSRRSDIVLDPFCGSGTVGVVCKRQDRRFVGLDLNIEYLQLAQKRLDNATFYQYEMVV